MYKIGVDKMPDLEATKDFKQDQSDLILKMLIEDYQSVFQVDLDTGNVQVLKTKDNIVTDNSNFSWQKSREEIFSQIYKDDKYLLKKLSLENMREYYDKQTSLFPFEIRSINEEKVYDWIKVNARIVKGAKKELLITTQITNENHMLQKIIDLYVLNNLDYFVLIDINHNSYTMFNGNPKSPLPPESGIDYENDVKQYNKRFVVPEELEETNNNMMIQNILKKLEIDDVFEFTAGFFDLQGQYHRSRIQFSYYDKLAGLVVITRTDITQIYLDEGEKERRLANALREAKHDAMTNLYNSKAANELIKNAVLHQYRAKAVLFFVDLDNFKLVNDTLGHQVGDKVICHVAKKLMDLASKEGIAGRIGGDEFVLFLPVTSTMERVEEYAQQICHSLYDCNIVKDKNLPVSCSVGIATYPKDGTTYKELLLKSDQALYDAKRHGKNCFSFYSSVLENKKPNHGL